MYKVYIKLDSNKCITNVESTAFHTEEELTGQGYIYIDEGEDGETYGHAQPNYMLNKYRKSTYDEKGYPNFKYLNKKIIEISQEEKNKFSANSYKKATEQEKINATLMKEIALLKAGVKNGI